MQSLDLFFEKYSNNPYGFGIKGMKDPKAVDKLIITPQGSLEYYNSAIFLDAITDAFQAFPHVKTYALDFQKVEYISYKGIGALIQLVNKAKTARKAITLRNLNEELRSIVYILRRIYQTNESPEKKES
jgi:anti-anti-sigma factor